ncbi:MULTISPECIES: PIN-like domain-containing protein [unclassified Streptomyces]|uniref:PIN-like domain-containing protein n=1 Tax=unclassified Streptomyces TaxID=2593676 RepID=UPI00278C6217|nr:MULTISPECIES: PIN-like domain-containing protein [unclassified Streptomyces]
MIRQYKDWLQRNPPEDSPDRAAFFSQGTVVLDTNVLLSLYEYTPDARAEVLQALASVQDRLWLPHQVGLEFVKGRHRVIAERHKALKAAPNSINKHMGEANKAIIAARQLVQDLLLKYARDITGSEELASLISSQSIDALLGDWKKELIARVKSLSAGSDIALSSVDAEDPVLPKVAELFGENVAAQPSPDELRHRVEEASSYRFPNKIPPGFSDAGKGTPIDAAGDYLLWEEVIRFASDSTEREHLLFVSSDTKEDWYETEGGQRRPWPSLATEMRIRAGTELRIETPGQFYRGVKQYLHARIADTTYEEIDRAAEVPSNPVITDSGAVGAAPPTELVLAATKAAGLSPSALRTMDDLADIQRLTWWLIGVTAQLGRRTPSDDEPDVALEAAIRAEEPPSAHWHPGTTLRLGEWPYRSSTWIAPWFAQAVNSTSQNDRRTLQALAAQHLDLAPPPA